MDFDEIIRRRRSVRRFDEQQVRRETIIEIINDARTAPSWANSQERKVYIATHSCAAAIRREYLEQSQRGMIGISDFSFTHRAEWSKRAQDNMAEFESGMEKFMGDDVEEFVHVQDTLYDAPTIVYLTLPKEASKWAILDMGAFEMALMMSATARGLDTMVAYAFVKYPDIIRKHIPIPENEDIAIGIGIGYAKEDAKINQYRSTRDPLTEIMLLQG